MNLCHSTVPCNRSLQAQTAFAIHPQHPLLKMDVLLAFVVNKMKKQNDELCIEKKCRASLRKIFVYFKSFLSQVFGYNINEVLIKWYKPH